MADDVETVASAAEGDLNVEPVRVLISYAHDNPAHKEQVRRFWTLLRREGLDAKLDVVAANERQFWPQWMSEQIRLARFVLVVASPGYRERAEGAGDPAVGRGVRWEARQLMELLYADAEAGRRKVVPVILPGGDEAGLPDWSSPVGGTTYRVEELTSAGVDALVRLLTGQPLEMEPPLGMVRRLPPRPLATLDEGKRVAEKPAGPSLRTEVVVEAAVEEDASAGGSRLLRCVVSLAGSPLGERVAVLPVGVWRVWESLGAGVQAAGERLLAVGRALAGAMLDEAGHRLVAELVDRLRPGDWVDFVLVAGDEALTLPIELLRLTGSEGQDLGPLALLGGVTVRRRVASSSQPAAVSVPGPLKVLAVVAAPEESLTDNPPLDVEAEMQAVLDAVSDPTIELGGQVRILEVASLGQVAEALRADRYHVLHLAAHGSPVSVELEDEDGHPQQVTARDLMRALRDADSRVPLVVLSSCSGASGSAGAMAAGLVRAGADRVVAMQAPVTDAYATVLVAALYRELAAFPDQPVAAALARARRRAEQRPREKHARLPEYGVATLLSAGDDGPLVDSGLAPVPLHRAQVVPSGTSVRELPLGRLVGRRRQLREATAALRRTARAREEHGAISGAQLVGIGGIGKTAIAGRLVTRLRGDGMRIAVHEGRWNPTALLAAVARAIKDVPELAGAAEALASSTMEDVAKAEVVAQLLATVPLLLVFDDFEQNLTPGGGGFVDPAFDELLTGWCTAAEVGAVLVTCRYPLPDDDRYLVRVPVPPLSTAELRRLFLRLPALRDLPPEDLRLVTRVIGGHPRLVEYVDALLRGRPAQLKSVQAKLRALARQEGVDLRRPRALGEAVDAVLVLGSADILLGELLALLSEDERAVLRQLSVCRAPMTLDDLAFILNPQGDEQPARSLDHLRADVEHLVDLTLLAPGPDIIVHPWTAEVLDRRDTSDRRELHGRALAMRWRRFDNSSADYLDLLELPRHLAALGEYGQIAQVAEGAVRALPGVLAASAFLAEVRPLIPTVQPAWILVAKLEYEAVRSAGNLTSAQSLLTAMRQVVEGQLAADPSDPDWAGWLSVVLVDLGDLARDTDSLSAAADYYQTALTAAGRFVRDNPTSTWWQNQPALTHDRLGDVAVAAGDLGGAGEHYRAALAIRERLAAADPGNAQWQRDLAHVRDRLAKLSEKAERPESPEGGYSAVE
ncbi:MAG TPA: CHAT domain-containing protein [Micromonosporaceae bacterium]|nr:CHAT domain-containing protein [Micromonosporaceae bacterium]